MSICRRCVVLVFLGALVFAPSARAGSWPFPASSENQFPTQCKGFCVAGSFCTDSTCPTPQCYLPDDLPSLLMCGGVGDGCGGLGICVPVFRSLRWMGRLFTFVIDHTYCDANRCYDSSEPISQVVCGGAFTAGCGVGHCVGLAYEDACFFYLETSPVSELFCGCRKARGEVTPGCGIGICEGGALCDNCFCYLPNVPAVHRVCPGGARTFQKVYVKPGGSFDHALAGIETRDSGFLMAGANFSTGLALRTDPEGNIIWSRKYSTTSVINGLSDTGDGFLLGGNTLVKTDDAGSVVWSKKLPGPAKAVRVITDGSIVVAGEDVPLVETPLTIQSQLQPGVVQAPWTPTLANAGATASDYPLSAVTICESAADRLCNGILTGACLCEGECKKALLGADFGGRIWDVDRATGATSNPRSTGIGSLAGIAFSPTGLLYGLTASLSGSSSLYRINPITGASTLVGPTGQSSLLEGDIAVDPTGTIYGMYGFGLTLFRLDPNTGAATIVGPLQGVVDPSAMTFDDKGTLYVLDGTAGVLHVVDKTTGATIQSVTLKPPLPVHTLEGMSFCPQAQKLYVSIGFVAGTPMLMTLNPASGVLLNVGTTGATDLSGLAFHP